MVVGLSPCIERYFMLKKAVCCLSENLLSVLILTDIELEKRNKMCCVSTWNAIDVPISTAALTSAQIDVTNLAVLPH